MSSPKQPNFQQQLMMLQANQPKPVTQLPQQMQPTAPPVLNLSQLQDQALKAEGKLPTDLQALSANPVFGQDAATDYQNKFFQAAIQPMIEQRKQGLFNEGRMNSSFGGGELGNLEVTGAQNAFFAGQDFRNNEINNVLKRRGLLSGQTQTAQQQNAADIDRSLGLESQTTNRLNSLNQYQSGGYGQNLSAGLGLFDRARSDYQNQIASRNQLFSGLAGAAGGLLRF